MIQWSPFSWLQADKRRSGCGQVIDDVKGVTLCGLGTVSDAVKTELEGDKASKTKNKARMISEPPLYSLIPHRTS